ncbi:MAG: ECF transporter S component [Fusicatenibacter sp.]|nr:ECF transporter S component [Fusicatenibacter sp.]
MKRPNALQLCFLAFCAALNLIGGTIALMLRLPIYLDTLGTMLSAALFGPLWGMVPGLISGLISGFTSDIYALYYIPVQLIIGFLTGCVFSKRNPKGWRLVPAAAMISLPGTVVSSAITAFVFGGITSSGSTVLVQLLHGFGMNLTLAVCMVQAATDYVDRILVLALTLAVLSLLPGSIRYHLQKGDVRHGSL